MTRQVFLMTAVVLGTSVLCLSAQQETASRPADARLVTYSVADLVVPMPKKRPELEGVTVIRTCEATTTEETLMKLIRSTVAPGTWVDNGGIGEMQFFPLGMSLVIRQKQEVHEEIAALLAALRKPQELEIVVETKIVTISDETLRNVNHPLSPLAWEINKVLAFLSDTQVFMFMEAAQGDKRLNVMQSPRITLSNGERHTIKVGDEQRFLTSVEVAAENNKVVVRQKQETVMTNGLTHDVQAVVSADRKQVRVSMNLQMQTVEKTEAFPVTVPRQKPDGTDDKTPLTLQVQIPKLWRQSVEQTLLIPDGQTAVLYGGSTSVTHINLGPPVLSRIPYVSRLFKNVGYSSSEQHLLVFVKARIVTGAEAPTPPQVSSR